MAERTDQKTRPLLPRLPQLRGITRTPSLKVASSLDTIADNHQRTDTVTDPQIVCPSCRTQIKLTESLAAPLIAETRRKLDQQLAAREADFGRREALLKEAQEQIARARETVEEQVAAKLKTERFSIAEDGAVQHR
jgi:hypothetical protein